MTEFGIVTHQIRSGCTWLIMIRSGNGFPQDEQPPSVPQQNLFDKVMIFGGNLQGLLNFELVSNSCAINAKLYCQQLNCVYDKLKKDYVRSPTSRLTKENSNSWTVSPFSPNATPSDYDLFCSMSTFSVTNNSTLLMK